MQGDKKNQTAGYFFLKLFPVQKKRGETSWWGPFTQHRNDAAFFDEKQQPKNVTVAGSCVLGACHCDSSFEFWSFFFGELGGGVLDELKLDSVRSVITLTARTTRCGGRDNVSGRKPSICRSFSEIMEFGRKKNQKKIKMDPLEQWQSKLPCFQLKSSSLSWIEKKTIKNSSIEIKRKWLRMTKDNPFSVKTNLFDRHEENTRTLAEPNPSKKLKRKRNSVTKNYEATEEYGGHALPPLSSRGGEKSWRGALGIMERERKERGK